MRRTRWNCKVTDGKRTGVYSVKTVGAAVHQFRRQFGVQTKTDHETGGWKGISTSVA